MWPRVSPAGSRAIAATMSNRWPPDRGSERFGAALSAAPAVELTRIALNRFPAVFAFSGQSASTPGLVTRIESQLDATARLRFVTRSDALGGQLEDGLVAG